MKSILLVEDDRTLNASICYRIKTSGYSIKPEYTYAGAKKEVLAHKYDLIILDINLPDGNGIKLCQKIHALLDIPIIILTAKDLENEIIEGFDAGASDYVTKPFSMRVLLRRIAAILNRSYYSRDEVVSCGNLKIDLSKSEIFKNGKRIDLTQNELRLMEQFLKNRRQLLTRAQLLQALWDNAGNFVEEHTLTTLVSRLRTKLSDNEYNYIKTYYGIGYRWIGEYNDE